MLILVHVVNSNGDLFDLSSLIRIISIVQPDEIYNLSARAKFKCLLMYYNVPKTLTLLAFLESWKHYKV